MTAAPDPVTGPGYRIRLMVSFRHPYCFSVFRASLRYTGCVRFLNRREWSWVLYDCANSAFVLIVMTAVLPIYFKDVASHGITPAISTAHWGFVNSFASLVLALLAPILGVLADFPGRKKRFWAGFLLLGCLFTLALPLVGEGMWMLCLILFFFARIGYAGSNIFYDAMLVDVAPKKRMDWVSASGYAWGYIGSTIPFLAGIFLIRGWDKLGFSSSASATRWVFVITALWWFLFSLPMWKNVKQVYAVAPSRSPVRDALRRLGNTLRNLRRHREAFLFLAAYFFYIDGVDTIIVMATSYGRDVGIEGSTLILMVLVIQLAAFPFALVYGRLAQVFSAKTMLLFGICVYVLIVLLGFALPFFPTNESKTALFWVISLLVASSQGGIQALSRSFFGKLIPVENSAEFFGFYNVFGKFAAILGPFLMGFLARTTGDTRWGVLGILLLFLIGGTILLRVRPAGQVESPGGT